MATARTRTKGGGRHDFSHTTHPLLAVLRGRVSRVLKSFARESTCARRVVKAIFLTHTAHTTVANINANIIANQYIRTTRYRPIKLLLPWGFIKLDCPILSRPAWDEPPSSPSLPPINDSAPSLNDPPESWAASIMGLAIAPI